MWNNAKARAERDGVPFSISVEDIVIPETCPVLGVTLAQRLGKQGGGPNSPSLDRIVASLGYIPGNVVVISMRANRLKNDASVKELRSLATFYAPFGDPPCDGSSRPF